jgi:hypothetical protein
MNGSCLADCCCRCCCAIRSAALAVYACGVAWCMYISLVQDALCAASDMLISACGRATACLLSLGLGSDRRTRSARPVHALPHTAAVWEVPTDQAAATDLGILSFKCIRRSHCFWQCACSQLGIHWVDRARLQPHQHLAWGTFRNGVVLHQLQDLWPASAVDHDCLHFLESSICQAACCRAYCPDRP